MLPWLATLFVVAHLPQTRMSGVGLSEAKKYFKQFAFLVVYLVKL